MLQFQLPTAITPALTYDAAIDGVSYRFNFQYMTRNEAWYLTIQDLLGNDLLSNTILVPNYDLWRKYVSSDIPKGMLLLEYTENYESPPKVTLENLSTSFNLIYLTPQEMER